MAHHNKISLGEHLRVARELAGYSIRQLAKQAGVHYSNVSRLESGEITHPSPDLLQRLAAALDIEAAELLAYVGVKPELPEPRMYFRRKLGVDAEEAEVLARLIEDHQARKQAKKKGGGNHEETN